jgi:hypothetical protein
MLERIYALKRKEITGGEKSIMTLMKYTIYEITLRTQIDDDKIGGTCITHRTDEKTPQYFIRKSKDKNSLKTSTIGYVDNIKLYLK